MDGTKTMCGLAHAFDCKLPASIEAPRSNLVTTMPQNNRNYGPLIVMLISGFFVGNVFAGPPAAEPSAELAQEWEFQRHVLPVLTKTGCNSGACHGALAGKGGFKLSLRGYDPTGDFAAITRQSRGRRIDLADPSRSLLLLKPTTAVPHKGGLRLELGSPEYTVLSEWLVQGLKPPTDSSPKLIRLEVIPHEIELQPTAEHSIVVRAHYSDNRIEDVTRWAIYSSADESVIQVDAIGHIQVVGPGEGSVVVWFSSQIALSRVTVPYTNSISTKDSAQPPRNNLIDDLVVKKLESLNLVPSPLADDTEFVRRVFLSVIGTLPRDEETRRFLSNMQPDKRERLIDELLARTEFTDFWTYKWSDLLLVNGRRLRPPAVKAYHTWIREHVRKNTPWDEVVRQIVTASGKTTENGAANFYALHQDPETITENVCQAFMGLSIGCARCHNHPLEKWTNDQYYGMASHFARVRGKGWGGDPRGGNGERIVFVASSGELMQPLRGKPQPPTPLDGISLAFNLPEDRREHLANWLTAPQNPYFTRAIVNRVWAALFGRGIVEPVDDMRMSNPASNEALLEALSQYMIEHSYNVQDLIRLIVQSATFQRSSATRPENAGDHRFFSHYYAHRLAAEELLDAIAQVTGVPSEFTEIGFEGNDVEKTEAYPLGTRAIQLADSAVASKFLKTFGRNDRDITCECERSNTPNLVQVLHLNNGNTVNERLHNPQSCIRNMLDDNQSWESRIEHVYISALSRFPNPSERKRLIDELSAVPEDQRQMALEDLYWSVMSSREFLFNH